MRIEDNAPLRKRQLLGLVPSRIIESMRGYTGARRTQTFRMHVTHRSALAHRSYVRSTRVLLYNPGRGLRSGGIFGFSDLLYGIAIDLQSFYLRYYCYWSLHTINTNPYSFKKRARIY